MTLYVGLDLGPDETVLCCLDADATTVLEATLPSEPAALLAKLSRCKTRSDWRPVRFRSGSMEL